MDTFDISRVTITFDAVLTNTAPAGHTQPVLDDEAVKRGVRKMLGRDAVFSAPVVDVQAVDSFTRDPD